ncbi:MULTISPECIES: hypothetical protein [Streptomyces]|uniref:Uncharacterized protein n=1 Tax=Streptomyces venezuelae (strain ATCC 10712 / CBS 650.69 / DSM 40230 / JCM 4526 / NBRC 13096 / PD 04745) TaxID=953739 RepID=F2RCF6_STRVP|nr:hypothetical protein [Streptomyces venezuelae]CCA54314.1 hypothetical protein SVEN_1027 [Streptomyces venezuelae ATCC 10712]
MNLQQRAGNYVNASWSMVRLRDLIYDMLGLLFRELSAHGGMAGDDDAGRAFAAVYKPAVKTVFEAAGLAHQVMANGAGALLKATEDFLKQESAIAASLLGQSVAPDIGAQPSRPDCDPRAGHNVEELPEVVGETSWNDQYLLGSRFHGQRDKLRKTANAWRSAAGILDDAYWDSEGAWRTATAQQLGETATAVQTFFNVFVGKTPPPSEVGETRP